VELPQGGFGASHVQICRLQRFFIFVLDDGSVNADVDQAEDAFVV
jgi:hypothetical protein